MIFKSVSDSLTQNALDEGMKVMNEFTRVTWNRNMPNAKILNTREEIDQLRGMKTERWVKGFTHGTDVCVLSFDKMETVSDKKLTEGEYKNLVKHELCHLYYAMLTNNKRVPVWLIEGLAVFLSGQLESRTRPEKFAVFLDYFSNGGAGVYRETGFVVELLINKFGKDKIVQFVKEMKEVNSEEEVGGKFKEIFGIDLTYEALNDLYTK